jgi:hypothetical protein
MLQHYSHHLQIPRDLPLKLNGQVVKLPKPTQNGGTAPRSAITNADISLV